VINLYLVQLLTHTNLQVFLDIGLCPEGLRGDRTLGDASAICTDATPLGRVTIGISSDIL